MLNKTIIVLTSVLTFGSVSASFAYEDPENKIGDRYPFLEQRDSAVTTTKATRTNLVRRQSNQRSGVAAYAVEDPENKIGDRYPFLEPRIVQNSRVSTASRHARHVVRHRA